MLNIGDIIEIHGDNCEIIYTKNYNDENYICVEFTDYQPKYNIYKYKFENEKLMVAEVTEQEELVPIMTEIAQKGLEETGLVDEFMKAYEEEIKND